jgi:transposase-like protein
LSQIADPESLVWGDLDAASSGLMKLFLETLAVSEVEARVGARHYERSECRKDHRNGYRERQVQTSFATITVKIPRLRGQGYVPSVLEHNSRAIPEVEGWVARAFTCGLSRAEIIRLMESLTGCRPSDRLLRKVQVEQDERVKAWRARSLPGRWQYVFLDAAWAKDVVGANAIRICILSAKGVTSDGRIEMLGFERSRVENESAWRGFLMRLKERGVRSEDLDLVISDEHGSIRKALQEVFGDVPHQLCWAHRMRNVRKHVRASDRKALLAGLRAVYQAPHPAVVASVEEDLGQLLAFFGCDQLHWEYIRTTNPIERAFRELRRQNFGCGAFANRDSCNRAVWRVFSWLNERWQGKDIWDPRRRRNNKKRITKAA